MDKNAIKKFAVWARKELIERVSQKAMQYGFKKDNIIAADSDSIHGVILSDAQKKQRQALISEINAKGFKEVMEEVAYTWFNRFIALRFMEVNEYLPTRVRVFTNAENKFEPQILDEVFHLDLDGLDMDHVYELKNTNQKEELYKYLLITQCNALNSVLLGMFQRISDYTELLFPDNLLNKASEDGSVKGSVLYHMITDIPQSDWQDAVQIIGWLYQYYNAEKKDEVFAALKKNVKITKENIPAATQLFTPDWIVRYMVQNSLGRLWVEGHPGDMEKFLPSDEERKQYAAGDRDPDDPKWYYYLEEAEQEPEVKAQLAEIRKEYAAMNPEQIKCIDPCCGSGHILVYLFDVLVQIYESYGYTTREAVESIIRNNLYGLDIDDRAAQLAYFSVMMKACKYDSRFLKRKDEDGNPKIPQPKVYAIQESNTINRKQLKYFGWQMDENERSQAETQLLALLNSFQDAKEYGSILSIEQYNWELLYHFVLSCDYSDQMELDAVGLKETQDKLLQLVQLGAVLAQKYDVVCTNPPYMGSSGMSAKLSDFVKKNYPDSKSDLFACCIEKGNSMTAKNGFNCMVTMQSWMFLSSFEKMRTTLLQTKNITNLMHMENMVMGIAFGTAVTVFQNNYISGYKGTYNHITMSDIVNEQPKEFPVSKNRFAQVSANNFCQIPGSPVAYWASDRIVNIFFSQKQLSYYGQPKQGLATGDNDRFLRFWHEPSIKKIGFGYKNRETAAESGNKWFPCNKGGEYRKWFGNNYYVVNWENDGCEIRNFTDDRGKLRSRPQNMDKYFREGITWSTLSSGNLSMRYSPQGTLFETKGSVCFFDDLQKMYYALGLLNSLIVNQILLILCPTLDFHEGPIGKIPLLFDESKSERVIDYVEKNIIFSKSDWDSFETSWDFKKHPLVQLCHGVKNKSGEEQAYIEDAYNELEYDCNDCFNQLKANEEELNRIFIDIYGLQDELTPEVKDKDVTVHYLVDTKDNIPASLQGSNYVLTRRDAIVSLLSYAVGCMFGRYSLDVEGLAYAGGEWDASKYVTFPADKDNIIPICDDEYFDDDIVGRFVKFIEVVYGKDTLEENLKFIADALGGKGQPKEVIRNYFLNDFYADHCKIYQKRPIYWLFDSGKKNGFKALIYMHRYQPDTIARIRTDYVHEQQSRYRTAIADMESRIANASSTGERVKLNKILTKLKDQDTELRSYEEKIHHLADQMISIDLDDGVKVNYAKFQDVLAKIK